jgi:hypothetical protein
MLQHAGYLDGLESFVVTKKGHPKEGVLDWCASYSQSVEGSWSAIKSNSTTNSINLSTLKIYLLRRNDDERMVTVDDNRWGCYFDQNDSTRSQYAILRTSDVDNNAIIKDNNDKPSSRNRNHNEDESLNSKGEAACNEQWQQLPCISQVTAIRQSWHGYTINTNTQQSNRSLRLCNNIRCLSEQTSRCVSFGSR